MANLGDNVPSEKKSVRIAAEGQRGGDVKDERQTRTNRYIQRLGLRLSSRSSRETE